MGRTFIILFTAALLSGAWFVALGQERKPKEEPRPEKKVDPEDAKLLAYLEQRVTNDELLKRVDSLIRQLADTDFEKREEASRQLLTIGAAALPKLQLALKSDDTETARRAKECVEKIEKQAKEMGTPSEVVYQLLARRPAGTIETLVRYVPAVDDDAVEEQIYFGLEKLVENDAKAVAVLVPFLKDKAAGRRAVAGLLVARYGTEEQRKAARKLLDDADTTVRLRTVQGLLGAEDKAGIPTLIALLNQSSTTLAWQAEELLCWVAGEDSPKPRVGAGNVDKKKECQQAWQAWWQQEEKRIDLKEVKKAYRWPFLLLASQTVERQPKVILIGGDGAIRWELKSSEEVSSIQLLRCDRVLTAEYTSGAIERDLDGTTRWRDHTIESTWACQRMPNGNTRVAGSQRERAEITKDGVVIFHQTQKSLPRNENRLAALAPYLSSKGRLYYEREGTLLEVEPSTGVIEKTVRLQDAYRRIHYAEALPTGGYLLGTEEPDLCVEIDGSGKTIKKWPSSYPVLQGAREPNGLTLMLSLHHIAEVDSRGRLLWESSAQNVTKLHNGLSLIRVGLEWPDTNEVDLATSISRRLLETKSKDPVRRCYGARGLAQLKDQEARVTPRLLELLRDPDQKVREVSTNCLEKIARVEELPLYLEALKDPTTETRVAVLSVLRQFGSSPDQVAPLLIDALQDKNVLVRRQAANSLNAFPTHPGSVPALIKALKDPDKPTGDQISVAEYAIISLSCYGKNALPAVPDLIELLKNEKPGLRERAIRALTDLARRDDEIAAKVIPEFVKSLKDVQYEKEWGELASGLGIIGPRAKEAVPTLIDILEKHKTRDPKLARSIRASVLFALAEIKTGIMEAAPVVAAILIDPGSSESEIEEVVKILKQLGPDARSVVPLLEKALPQQNRDRQRLITEILKEIKRE
jgi:HEAT repeat protein